MKHWILGACAVVAGIGTAPAQLDAKKLAKLAGEIVPIVENATKTKLTKLEVRLADRDELAEVVMRQARALLKASGKKAAAAAARSSKGMARLLLAKFVPDEFAILMNAANFERNGRAVGIPDFDSDDTYRAVLVHECIHAVDHLNHDWFATMEKRKNDAERHAFTAVVEGHAQHVAAKICKDNGWEEGFARFSKGIGKLPPDMDEATRLITSIRLANLYSAYHEGHKFIDHLAATGGAERVAKAFREPPASFEEIIHPEWYLDPKSRPKRLYDLVAPMKAFAEELPTAEWRVRLVQATRPQVAAAIQLLPDEDKKRVLNALRANRMAVAVDKKNPQARMVMAAVYEFSSPTEANNYVAAVAKLMKIKMEKMSGGPIEIGKPRFEDLRRDGWQGRLARQEITAQGRKMPVMTLVATRGSIACEILYSNCTATTEKIAGQAATILAKAARKKE